MERPPFIRLPRDCEGHPRSGNRIQPNQTRHHPAFEVSRVQPYLERKVCLGTPSEGELRRGDLVLQIADRDANKLSHQQAHDTIKNAGNQLKLAIQRIQTSGAPFSHPAPTTALHYSGANPLSSLPSSTMNRTYSPGYQPLPTSSLPTGFRPHVPDPEGFVAAELQEYSEEKRREKDSIVHQTYRTNPLITPKAKTKHDLPMGSYLRHVQDPNWTAPPHPGATPVQNATVMRKMQEATGTQGTPVFTATNPNNPDEPVSVFHKQYNSPINIYSPQAVAETLSAQTGLQPSNNSSSRSVPAAKPPPNQPIRMTPQHYKMADITQSPTYQLIHDEEWKDLRKGDLKEQPALQHQVYNVSWGADAQVNALGVPKGKVLQSGSFNTIKNTLIMGQSQY